MRNLKKILKGNRNTLKDRVDLDQVMISNDLSFAELNFSSDNSDILKSYQNLNKKLQTRNRFIQNLKAVITHINFIPVLKPVYTAILTAVIIFGVIELNNFNTPVQYAEITVNLGEKVNLYVTDEVQVWVNSGSTIKIPLEIKKNPKIYLNGEAYFEINKNRGKAIRVIANELNLKAQKASFNVNSENNTVIAHIKQGQVELYNPNLPKDTKLTLTQNDEAIYNSRFEFIAVENNISTNYLAWHTGIVKFNQTPMSKVATSISEIYEIPVVITNDEIRKSDFTAKFKNATIDEILDTIQSTFNCEISADGSNIVIN